MADDLIALPPYPTGQRLMRQKSVSARLDAWLWGILRAFAGLAVGVVLIVAMVALLFWNETRVLQAERALAQGIIPAADPVDLTVWLIRAAGLALLVAGFALVAGPLGAIANLISGLGTMVRFATGLFATALGLAVGLATIALVWLFYQPWISAIVLLAGAALIAVILTIGLRIANARYPSTPPPPPDDQALP